jgi:LAO/AO transport system kinase
MQDHSLDDGVYIRSMATRGQYGGVAKATGDAVRALQLADFDVIFVETVGVGQAEVDVARIAGTVVLIVAPGLGDEVQAMKAGLLEVAHIVVVNKADREGADATIRDLQEWAPLVVRTVAIKGEGLPELIQAIAEHQRIVDIQRKG